MSTRAPGAPSGATSLAAIARFATDIDPDLRERLGLTSSTPNASTLGRLLACLNGDALDDALGAWLTRHAADPVEEAGDTLVGLAVDDKTVRGSRTDGRAVHLLAAALHTCRTVIAQRQITTKSNESPAFAPLLDRIDLRGPVVTADAMHTQRVHAEHLKRGQAGDVLVPDTAAPGPAPYTTTADRPDNRGHTQARSPTCTPAPPTDNRPRPATVRRDQAYTPLMPHHHHAHDSPKLHNCKENAKPL
ncbi:ISAs1 family transposase [Streptomyces phytohabitans]|uniref:ISAs1 family transposase n=1 Tax=Streptomyces phytohabitans TaxID=1150371 RepID=UPI00345B839B